MGNADRIIRLAAAIAIGVFYGLNLISGTVAIALGVVAVALLATSLLSWCPIYLPFGLSTCKTAKSG